MDWTHVPCIGRPILNHCTTREVPKFNFLGHLHTVFLNDCTIFQFLPILHKGSSFSTSSPTLVHLSIIAILMGVKWYLIVDLVCVSLMNSEGWARSFSGSWLIFKGHKMEKKGLWWGQSKVGQSGHEQGHTHLGQVCICICQFPEPVFPTSQNHLGRFKKL